MFGFSRRRKKFGRLKVYLGEQGTKSPIRPAKRHTQSNGESMGLVSAQGHADDLNCQCSSAASDLNNYTLGNSDNWMEVSTSGDNPAPRFHHAAAVIGSKMVVVGGESGRGLLDDTQVLSLDTLSWTPSAPKVYLSPTGLPLKIPACKGHRLVSWGKKVLLIGGKSDHASDRISVWSFDVETECWSHVEGKGDLPIARSGHSVVRAGPVLILFGGEDTKGRKLNDLHMFDLKSLMWLPLHHTGTGPSPRSNHVAALYDDRILLVFGGQSKSKILNDLHSLDFETMVWLRIKIRGHHPSPRAGCCGVLCGTKWYIAGGGSKKKRHTETLVLDVLKLEMSVAVSSPPSSVTTNRGFSLVPVHYKDKIFLVAFGGNKKEPSNQVEILIMVKDDHCMSWRTAPDRDPLYGNCPTSTLVLAAHLKTGGTPCSIDPVARRNLASVVEHSKSARKSLSETCVDPNSINSSVSLRKQFHHEEEYDSSVKMQKTLGDDKNKEGDDCSQSLKQRSKRQESSVKVDSFGILLDTEEAPSITDSENSNPNPFQKQGNGNLPTGSDDIAPIETPDGKSVLLSTPSNIYQMYEIKLANLTKKNVLLEEQLAAELASRETTEKSLTSVTKSRQDMEKKLADTVKEVELLKEKLAGVEIAQEEANSLSNIVHSDNVRLEHDVAFLKAVLDDTQKELHSTRGVLAGERARAFQLQVEVFHLKQRLQPMDNRAPTPRKPFHM